MLLDCPGKDHSKKYFLVLVNSATMCSGYRLQGRNQLYGVHRSNHQASTPHSKRSNKQVGSSCASPPSGQNCNTCVRTCERSCGSGAASVAMLVSASELTVCEEQHYLQDSVLRAAFHMLDRDQVQAHE
eukprot:304176-Amphidinium_carterae.2